jgi:hypothetical protein
MTRGNRWRCAGFDSTAPDSCANCMIIDNTETA